MVHEIYTIDETEPFLNIKARLKLDKNELNTSANFAVNIATYTAPGTGPSNPNTLEDIFTLTHQNTIIAAANLGANFSKSIENQYPPMVNKLNEKFNSEVVGIEQKVIVPSTSIELHDQTLTITKNLPLRNHSCIANINYNTKNKTTSVNFSIFGHNGFNRWDNVVLDNYLDLTSVGSKFIIPPYFDIKKQVANFEVKIENEKQVKAVIDTINQSIETSFETHDFSKATRKLIEKRIELITDLSKNYPILSEKLNNIKFIIGNKFTWREFKEIDDKDAAKKIIKKLIIIGNLPNSVFPLEDMIIIGTENPDFFKVVTNHSESVQHLSKLWFSFENVLNAWKKNPEFFNIVIKNPQILEYFSPLNLSFEDGKNLWKENPEFY